MSDSRTGGARAAVLTGLGAALLVAGEVPASVFAQDAPRAAVPAAGPGPDGPRPAPSAASNTRLPAPAAGPGPDGRRDPFARPAAPRAGATEAERPGGLAGLAVDDAVLRGIVRHGGGRVAFLEAPDGRTYAVRRTDRLFDAAVQDVADGAVTFLRDATAVPPEEREVRKRLRERTEDAR